MDPWSNGLLDIHHISTGRGNSVLAICPDGTSVMIDAGAVGGQIEALGPARPSGLRRPGEWIGMYALRHLRTTPRQELDYFVLTHFHGDHMGDVTAASPLAKSGDYRLTGVTDVAELLPIRTLIDRGFPDYNYPAPLTSEPVANYVRFVKYAEKRGTSVQKAMVGSRGQISLRNSPGSYPSFAVRVLAANGRVWTGRGEEAVDLTPALSTLKPEDFPPENSCSAAFRFDYGAFRYYTGGDLTCDTDFGTKPWRDVETAVAKVAGPVSACTLDHHGYYDATSPDFVRYMHPRVYVIQTWHASHPALSVLNEIYSPVLSTGPRDVFATGIVGAARLADARLSDKMLSQHGHIVIRVHPGGAHFEVLVLDDTTEQHNVLNRFGPYGSS